VRRLNFQINNLASQKLLIDLVGQSSPLAPVAFARGFLWGANDDDRTNLINYGYKEAIEEGLKEEYADGGGRRLWMTMVSRYPSQFSREYPSTDGARRAALKVFKPTQQDREEAWIVNNASNPQTMLRMRQLAEYLNELDINVPTVLWVIVAGYAAVPTLLDIE